jgi:ribosomal protein L11 methylase PrmA
LKNIKKVLDIGTATGDALSTIVDDLKDSKILGIDYN